jgi:hypothetical protein
MINNIIEATIFKLKIQRIRCTAATHSNDSGRYVVRVQTIAISWVTRFCNDHQQSTRTSLEVCGLNYMLLTWSTWYVACSGVGKPSDLFVYTPLKIVYSEFFPGNACIELLDNQVDEIRITVSFSYSYVDINLKLLKCTVK